MHLKIHVPDIVHKHKHLKTKYVHVFHPKVVHPERHSSIQFLHSRHDPNVGLINGGYPQPLLNLGPSREYRINEEDFFKWRREQQRRAQEKRRKLQKQHQNQYGDDYEEENGEYEDDQPNYDEELYRKHKANKANSSRRHQKESKHRNHNYADSSNTSKVYARGKPKRRPTLEDEEGKKYFVYGVNDQAEPTNFEAQYLSIDPTAGDPGYYSTLPKDTRKMASTHQDDIYSGLLAKKYNKEIAEKSKLLADINYNRKQQTKNLSQQK